MQGKENAKNNYWKADYFEDSNNYRGTEKKNYNGNKNLFKNRIEQSQETKNYDR